MLSNDWFDDFVVGPQCDETTDLAWLDRMHHSKQIARLVEHTDDNPLLRELGTVCNDVLGVDQIVSTGEKTSTRFRSGKSLSTELASNPVDQVHNSDLGGLNPMVELRYNLFGKMLANFHENDGKFLQAEEFDKCFKGE